VEWFTSDKNNALLDKFKQLEVWPIDSKSINGPLVGKSFAITGSLEGLSRDEASEKIRALGGTFQSSVGKGTTYLVYGTKIGESKRDNAKKFGTKTINQQQFTKLLGIE
jgi:DNA ligase (NAD+)